MSLFNSVRGNNNLCDCQNRTADVFEECDCRNRTTIIKDQVLVRDDELYKFKQNPNNHYPDDLRDKIEEVYCDCKEEHECCCGDENHVCLCGDENGVHECHCKCDDEVIDNLGENEVVINETEILSAIISSLIRIEEKLDILLQK